VSLHTGNPVAKPAYSPLYTGLNEAYDILTSCNVVVCMNLNLHESTLLALTVIGQAVKIHGWNGTTLQEVHP
jgi:hypothetical protein